MSGLTENIPASTFNLLLYVVWLYNIKKILPHKHISKRRIF